MINGIHHGCVIVSDMEKSLAFYRDKLGLKEVMNLKFDADPVMMDLQGTEPKQHLVMLAAGNAHVELIHYIEPKGQRSDHAPCDFPNMHICLQVDDIKAAYEKAKQFGIHTFHREPVFIQDSGTPLDGFGYVYFRGPDNEILEFIQPAS